MINIYADFYKHNALLKTTLNTEPIFFIHNKKTYYSRKHRVNHPFFYPIEAEVVIFYCKNNYQWLKELNTKNLLISKLRGDYCGSSY